jgi:hypothetical protein
MIQFTPYCRRMGMRCVEMEDRHVAKGRLGGYRIIKKQSRQLLLP